MAWALVPITMHDTIIIVGTCHSYQCGLAPYSKAQIETFKTYIYDLCKSEAVQQIAEEMVADALSKEGLDDTIFASVAKLLNIPHLYIDLPRTMREVLKIDDYTLGIAAVPEGGGLADEALRKLLTQELSSEVRERCWYARLLSENTWPTVFICGAKHVDNMQKLISNVGQEVKVAHRDYQS